MEFEEFCRRFVAEIGKATADRSEEDRGHIAAYAVEAAQAAYDDWDESESPEEAAQTDMSYWE